MRGMQTDHAAALTLCEDIQNRLGWGVKHWAHASACITAPECALITAIATAAVRLVAVRGRGRELPWWVGNASQVGGPMCIGCYGLAPAGGGWQSIDHAATCPALEIDAAICAAVEAGNG